MFVIGTAGHIDHGKSSIIIRLTGIDPDRLPEEKERGMTIDIGFAHYDTPDGKRIGIIDVPGHERFVRNMIAGAGGIDAVILVVAADDGWMPQSQEHFQITKLLGTKYGLVVISKIDLVEESWVDLVEDDIRERLRGSFLENAPIIKLSAVTGEGFDRLKSEINHLADAVISREDIGKPRLYIDRSFVLAGLGGVVAGTLRGGPLRIGQEVVVYPAGRKGKVRTIQSHNEQIEVAHPGQRTSISLTGIDKEYLNRGSVITLPNIAGGYPEETVLALEVSLIAESPIILSSRRRLLMILGTTEVEGEIRLYGDKVIPPGGGGIIFLRPSKPILSFVGDRFILRLPTPQVTVGGGSVIDILNRFPQKKELRKYSYLEERVNLTPEKLVATELTKLLFIDKEKDFVWCNYSQSAVDGVIENLVRKSILNERGGRHCRSADIAPVVGTILSVLGEYFETHPHVDGLPVDVIVSLAGESVHSLEPILELMFERKQLVRKKNRFDLPGRIVTVKGELKKVANMIEQELLRGGFTPPTIKELLGDDSIRKEAIGYLEVSGTVVKVGSGLVFHVEKWREIVKIIHTMLDAGDTLTVAALREKLGSTRKYVVPILEETDRQKITFRQGDIRIKGENFEEE